MAPEIINHQPFDGIAADIFALGKTVFAYIKGGFPFSRAISTDSFYNLIITKQYAKFWAFHTQRKTANFNPSPEFRDIFQKLVEPDPATRIRIPEIKSHPWFNSEAATKEEFLDFFASKKLQTQGSIDLQVQNASLIIQQFKESYGQNPLFRSASERRLSILEAIPAAEIELKQKAMILKDTSSAFNSRSIYTGFVVEELYKCLVTYCKQKGEIKTLDCDNFNVLFLHLRL
jgi:serine/threonine protein kinase